MSWRKFNLTLIFEHFCSNPFFYPAVRPFNLGKKIYLTILVSGYDILMLFWFIIVISYIFNVYF